jgi:hypothetical protein
VPPALFAKNLPGGQPKLLNICEIKYIDRHPADSGDGSLPESISVTKKWLNWNRDWDYPAVSEGNWKADNESYIELGSGFEDSETLEQRYLSDATNFPVLILPIRKSKKKAEKAFVTVYSVETRWHHAIKKH